MPCSIEISTPVALKQLLFIAVQKGMSFGV
jgi:hypothetical protein